MEKTVLITGATGTIGKAITRNLAEMEYNIIFTARSVEKAKLLAAEIKLKKVTSKISYFICDLGEKEQVMELAAKIDGPIDVLINNAAVTPRDRQLTPAGIEMQWAVNVLGYHWMMKYFLPHLEKAENGRIVNVASYWAGHLDLADAEFKIRHYDNNTAYMQSKQANRMLSKYYSEQLKGITVNSCHPGDANSKLSNDLGFGGHETPEQAAATPVYLAVSEEVKDATGDYFQNKRKTACRFSQDKEAVKKLYELCEQY